VTRALRTILLALLFALIAGFVAGTLLRHRLERPVQYLGHGDVLNDLHLRGSPLERGAAT
jgi:hypothetical protein